MVATREKILEAIAKLVEEGKTPTLEGVRAIIGGGSFTTLARVLNEWKAEQKAKPAPAEPATESVPLDLAEKGENYAKGFVRELWEASQQKSEERLKAEREELSKLKAQLEAEGKEVMEAADRIAAENEGLREQIAKQKEELVAAQAKLAETLAEVSNLRGQCEGLREQFATLVAKIQPPVQSA